MFDRPPSDRPRLLEQAGFDPLLCETQIEYARDIMPADFNINEQALFALGVSESRIRRTRPKPGKRTLKTYSFSLKELQREGNLRDRGPSQGQSVKSL